MNQMMRAFVLCVICVTGAGVADEVKLIDEKRIFPAGEPRWKRPRRYHLWAMRLSPDGKKLLYPRADGEPPMTPEGAPDWSKAKYEMILRDLGSGLETVPPIDSVEWGWRTFFTRFNMFDPSGTKVAFVNISREKQKVGEHITAARPNMKIVLYDVSTRELAATNIEGPMAYAKFDRMGKALIVLRGARRSLDLYTAALGGLELKPLKAKGFIQGVCPAADVICIWSPPKRTGPPSRPGQRRRRGPQRLFLYDVEADKEIAELPINQRNRKLDDWETQWTADGRYLYYYDVREVTIETSKGPRERTRPVAGIWDRVGNKQAGRILDAAPVGRGPTPSTMVLAKRMEADWGGFFLHDAKSGTEYPLGDFSKKLVHASGAVVVYARTTEAGGEAAYMARIHVRSEKDKGK